MTGSKNFFISDPVSIPIDIPDKVHVVFNSPLVSGKLLQEPRVFLTDATDQSKMAPPLRLRGLLEPSGILVSGLKTFFSVSKQQKAVIRVSLMNAVTGDEEASLGFTLVSAPTAVEVSMISRGAVRDAEIRKLIAPEMRLDILAVFKLKNTNAFRAEFSMPGELKGGVHKDFIRYDYVQQQCHTDTSISRWTDTYPTRFFVLPLDEDVANNWISSSAEAERQMVLEPGEEKLVGIYASGERVATFIDNGISNSSHGSVHVVRGCQRTCDGINRLMLRDPGDGPGGHGPTGCYTEMEYGDVPAGVDTRGAYWLLNAESTMLRARNAFLGAQDDPASRTISFLPAQLTIF